MSNVFDCLLLKRSVVSILVIFQLLHIAKFLSKSGVAFLKGSKNVISNHLRIMVVILQPFFKSCFARRVSFSTDLGFQ